MAYYVMLFVAGFAGSFHCIGMCGGFACALGHDPRGGVPTVWRHVLYNSGRLTSYCFLGALAGAVGQVLCTAHGLVVPQLSAPLELSQRILAVVAGGLMVVMALQFFGLFNRFQYVTAGFGGNTLAVSLRSLFTAPGPAAPLAFGVFNGFLPCPLVYAFLAEAAGTAAPLPGMLTMAAFGLGTFPAMLTMGAIGRLLAPNWRRRGVWLAGSLILLLGLLTIGRGLMPMTMHMSHGLPAGSSI